MAELELPVASANGSSADPSDAGSAWARFERWLEWGSERVNPILVKEARQALKSNHFVITFLLLLVCAWGWSLLGILAQMPDIQFNGGGMPMLQGYFLVLIVPLLLIVPFSAFRSLAAERQTARRTLASRRAAEWRRGPVGKRWSNPGWGPW